MSFSDITLFASVRKRLDWLTQRQEVLAQNIANADTPKYRASDLKAYKFKDILRRESMQLNMIASEVNHLPGQRKRIRDFSEQKDRLPYETAPNGNAVIIEEQMAKVNESQINHQFTTNIYKKHIQMFMMALGR
ncbi:MAG: flagellar basal body rod protein FlgB [Rhodospirillales bacterium]|nr:flagellar basal body rod protein FlgB [Rhodospirillales bacterium]